ncbi:MAG TPA: hypothetical protein VES20_23345 [Bryobacteraceae bacterium]|nr:hypothetical protein [Bryobacteraceae bacterium]
MKANVAGVCFALLLTGCATRTASPWRAERVAGEVMLHPPAVQKSLSLRDCRGKYKLHPAAVLERRSEWLEAEDRGCVPAGAADAELRRAIESHRLSARDAAKALYGSSGTFVELHPGWRLRVITPLLKGGGYRLGNVLEKQVSSGPDAPVTLSASEFLGMETAWYSVERRLNEPGVRIRLAAAEVAVDGKIEKREQPVAKLFDLPADARRVRLLYLTRVSAADHDMLVLAAPSVRELDELTQKVQRDPASSCSTNPYCSAIPGGIAVRAEMPVVADGSLRWYPAGVTASEAKAVAVERVWRGKRVRVEGEFASLPLIEGDAIRTR